MYRIVSTVKYLVTFSKISDAKIASPIFNLLQASTYLYFFINQAPIIYYSIAHCK